MIGLPNDIDPPSLERVPTVEELVRLGLAVLVSTKPPRYRLTPEGQDIVYSTMRRNAYRMKKWRDRGRTSS